MGMIITKKKVPVNVVVPQQCPPKHQRAEQAQKKFPEKQPKESIAKKNPELQVNMIHKATQTDDHLQNAEKGKPLDEWLNENLCKNDIIKGEPRRREVGTWIEIRLFISSTFIDTHSERDILIQRVIPSINRKLAPMYIRVVPVDLRWGVLSSETKTCQDLQKICLNQIDKCRDNPMCTPWFLCLRTDRYGWVQDNYMPSHGFELPELFQWINNLDEYGKKLSITSLECIHAVQATKIRAEAPTVFFYKREIIPTVEGAANYPEQFRWIFDFEYVEHELNDPVLKYQYSVNPKTAEYQKDQEHLEKYIKNLPHVKWFDYQAQFKDAKITCRRKNAKSFGVGYVTGLDTFQNQVERDLMEAILANNDSVDSLQNDRLDLESIQHENAIKLKASTFVGRTTLLKKAFDYCRLSEGSNTMILHGEPGCGKSGLLAAVANKTINALRDNGHFIFTHAVDTCPGSNSLEGMLRRLHVCLRKYGCCKKYLRECEGSSSKLKEEHLKVLLECANEYPKKLFLIIVDAVNQFHSSLDAWNMWWLPPKDFPSNLKFMISTLNEENGTFTNACNVSPEAMCVRIDDMCKEDLQEIVKMTLSRFNKKLTDYDDPLVGNQMEKMLSKSKSPLYLIAACEALRKFGIFEKVTQYIESLPGTIPELFSFLLDEWSKDCGELFVKDVSAMLCLSRDGFLETQINDLLNYKEQKEKGDSIQLYNANFSRIYDSISPFLSGGGGGHLRYFHDQLKYAVQRKYMKDNGAFELTTHQIIRDFFGDIIIKQCCECPSEQPPSYFEHTLNQFVYHQLAAHSEETTMDYLKNSLRNIQFVKHRIVAKQQQSLSEEYTLALEKAINAEDMKALKEWQSFVQIYTPYIRAFPKFCYNMAITQAPSSYVTKDTALIEEPTHFTGYPLYWSNIPKESDPMVIKFQYSGSDSYSTDTKGNIVAIANGGRSTSVLLYNQTSGELLHDLKINGSPTVCLTDDGTHVFVGYRECLGSDGKMSLWNVATGNMESSASVLEKEIMKSPIERGNCFAVISWIEYTDKYVLIGTRWKDDPLSLNQNNLSWIAIADLKTCIKVRSWCTQKPGNKYCYHKDLQMIFSGHSYGIILGWDLEGNKLCSTSVENWNHVYSLASHPTQNKIISGFADSKMREWSASTSSLELHKEMQDNGNKEGTSSKSRNTLVSYDHDGGRILSTGLYDQILNIYSLDGELLEELRGHKGSIHKISLVKGTNKVITTGGKNECILWDLPATSTVRSSITNQMVQEKVGWCAFSVDGSEFVTISGRWIRVYDTATHTLKVSKQLCETKFHKYGVIHPDGVHVLVTKSYVTCYRLSDLEEISSHKISTYKKDIKSLAIDKKGTKLLVITNDMAKLLDVSDVKLIKDGNPSDSNYIGYNLQSCAISDDGKFGCVSQALSTKIFKLESGFETIFSLQDSAMSFMKFQASPVDSLYPPRLLYQSDTGMKLYDPETQEVVKTYIVGYQRKDDVKAIAADFIHNETLIMAVLNDGTLRIYDVESEENVYCFFNHRAQAYTSLAVHNSEKIFLAANENSMVYILKTKR